MQRETPYTVVGAGHGGEAMAAHLALMGYPVTLFNRTAAHVAGVLNFFSLAEGEGYRTVLTGPRRSWTTSSLPSAASRRTFWP